MGKGYGFGKTILFGEHFVVYGLPAIASAIGSKTTAVVERSNSYELIDNRPETPGYKKEKFDEQKISNENIFRTMGIDMTKTPLRITLGGNLIAASGVGASAASCAAIARALNEEFNLDYDDNKINEIAYEGEKGYHGTPSGIDNAAAVFGGLIWYKKNPSGGQNIMERIQIKEPVEIVLGNTGITSSTSVVVGDVKKAKEANPEKFDRTFKDYEKLVNIARSDLNEFNLKKVGELMNQNHKLLQEIGVSCKELDFLVDVARRNGAYGAKLTGTGRGGLMIALTPGKKLQEKVANAIEKEGFSVFRTKIGAR